MRNPVFAVLRLLLMRFAAAFLCTTVALAPLAGYGQEAPPATPQVPPVQEELIQAAVDQMPPPSGAGQAAVYYLGFAGFGEQKVFRKEEELAHTVLGTRFGSTARSLELVNDVHDHDTYPLATYGNLRFALQALGKRMDRDRDVLVLMLTSHGNGDGIALTNGPQLREMLSPSDLQILLDLSGIRWRVIVVSACYSGVFIPKLQSDTSLIITAADASHSSFGCSDDRDLTWFGEALLQEALPQACSLKFAFDDTSYIINRRENQQGVIHSNPQLYFGEKMPRKLEQIDITGKKCH